jgi:anti-sigma regulatory factor (Ser/Thr protein kinase)
MGGQAVDAAQFDPVPDDIRIPFPHGFPTALARRAVDAALQAWSVSHRADDILLVTTELVQNVTRHTASGGELHLALRPDGILIEVADTSPEPPVLLDSDPRVIGGRGLHILAALTSRWGCRVVSRGRHRKIVWAELAT